MLVSLVRSTVLSLTIHYELSDAYDGSTKVPMDLVTSQMLAWLIANCENSRSVDIALQAVAGADDSLPGKPLAECGALKLVLIRLEACTKPDSISSAALQYYRASGVLASGGVVQATEDRWGHYSYPIDDREMDNYRSSHTDHYDAWKSYCSYAYCWKLIISTLVRRTSLADHFVSDTNLNTRAIIAITIMPFCHWKKPNSLGDINLRDVNQKKSLEIATTVLMQHIQAESSGLSTVVLTAIVKSTAHYLVGFWPREEPRSASSSVLLILLSHVFFTSYGASPDTARAVAIALAAAAFATRTYPGGEDPPVSVEALEKRAVDVYKYYRTQESLTTDMVLELFIFGFFGLLPGIDFSDESTRAAAAPVNFRRLLRHVPRFDLSRRSNIHTLPRWMHLFDLTILKPASQSLISFANDTSPSCEVGLAYSCLPLLIHQPGSEDDQANLYIPALIALCRVESVELQDLFLRVIDAQPISTWPYLQSLQSAELHDSLEKLCRVLIDSYTPVASIAALHFELLVASIIIHTVYHNHYWLLAGQSALRPLLNLQDNFAGRISQPKQLSVDALLSGLGKCCKGDSTTEDHILHTMQSIADFCELTEAVNSIWPNKEAELHTRLKTLKNQLKPSSDRVARQSHWAEPGSVPSDALPKLELPSSGGDISF
ncbi:hypothetical protein FRC09_003700 [Ceratobasidium sp. 395]|nr:hypothetical protein FRC09_003700 [Ceratobasidium sp. 395]